MCCDIRCIELNSFEKFFLRELFMSSIVERTYSNPLYYLHFYKIIKDQVQNLLSRVSSQDYNITHDSFERIRRNMSCVMLDLHYLNQDWGKYVSEASLTISCVYERLRDQSGKIIFMQRPVVCLKGNPHLLDIHKEKGSIQNILQVLQPRLLAIAGFFQKIENDKTT
jgi:hypothetical protein